jgi:hypothetical protein
MRKVEVVSTRVLGWAWLCAGVIPRVWHWDLDEWSAGGDRIMVIGLVTQLAVD